VSSTLTTTKEVIMLYIVSRPDRETLEANPTLARAIARPNIQRILDAVPGAKGANVEFYRFRRHGDFEGVETWTYSVQADDPVVEAQVAAALRELFGALTMLAGTQRLAGESEPWELAVRGGRRRHRRVA